MSVNDMAHMAARHGNLCTYGKMFFPYKDRVADPTNEDIAKVENKEAVTNFRFPENQQDFNRELIECRYFQRPRKSQLPPSNWCDRKILPI